MIKACNFSNKILYDIIGQSSISLSVSMISDINLAFISILFDCLLSV